MNHETFDARVAAYALGALDGEDRAEFEAHLAAGCARCEAALREAREALAALAREAPPASPPPRLRDELLQRLAMSARRPTREELRRTWLRWTAATAAAMLVGGFLVGGWVAARYEARLGLAARQVSAAREQARRSDAALHARLAANEDVLALLRDPATRIIALRGAGPSPEAHGRLVWHEQAGGHLVVARLPPAPEGKAYEAWTIAGGRPRPAGLFQVNASGEAVHRVHAPGPVEVFAVTLEPAAGTDAPTGPIVLASQR